MYSSLLCTYLACASTCTCVVNFVNITSTCSSFHVCVQAEVMETMVDCSCHGSCEVSYMYCISVHVVNGDPAEKARNKHFLLPNKLFYFTCNFQYRKLGGLWTDTIQHHYLFMTNHCNMVCHDFLLNHIRFHTS